MFCKFLHFVYIFHDKAGSISFINTNKGHDLLYDVDINRIIKIYTNDIRDTNEILYSE